MPLTHDIGVRIPYPLLKKMSKDIFFLFYTYPISPASAGRISLTPAVRNPTPHNSTPIIRACFFVAAILTATFSAFARAQKKLHLARSAALKYQVWITL